MEIQIELQIEVQVELQMEMQMGSHQVFQWMVLNQHMSYTPLPLLPPQAIQH
jgi:hypothetical protein